jgi:hypothetical protein
MNLDLSGRYQCDTASLIHSAFVSISGIKDNDYAGIASFACLQHVSGINVTLMGMHSTSDQHYLFFSGGMIRQIFLIGTAALQMFWHNIGTRAADLAETGVFCLPLAQNNAAANLQLYARIRSFDGSTNSTDLPAESHEKGKAVAASLKRVFNASLREGPQRDRNGFVFAGMRVRPPLHGLGHDIKPAFVAQPIGGHLPDAKRVLRPVCLLCRRDLGQFMALFRIAAQHENDQIQPEVLGLVAVGAMILEIKKCDLPVLPAQVAQHRPTMADAGCMKACQGSPRRRKGRDPLGDRSALVAQHPAQRRTGIARHEQAGSFTHDLRHADTARGQSFHGGQIGIEGRKRWAFLQPVDQVWAVDPLDPVGHFVNREPSDPAGRFCKGRIKSGVWRYVPRHCHAAQYPELGSG